MNKRDRVEAVFNNKTVDYVPSCFWRHYSPEIERGEDVVEAHLKFYRDTGLDAVKISSDGYFGWPAPTLQDLKDTEALYEIEHVGMETSFMQKQIERARQIVDRLDGDCFTFYTLFCPMSVLRLQVGWNKMMECMHRDPAAVMHACDMIAQDETAMIDCLLRETGVDGIFYSVQNAEVTRFTLEQYHAWVEPSDRKVLEFANSLSRYNVLHCCGWDANEAGTYNHLESWRDYPSSMVSWAAYVDKKNVEEIRAFFRGRPVWGGFDNRVCGLMYTGSREEVQTETKRLIRQGGKQGFMLGPDCSLPTDIATERIRWVVEAAQSAER